MPASTARLPPGAGSSDRRSARLRRRAARRRLCIRGARAPGRASRALLHEGLELDAVALVPGALPCVQVERYEGGSTARRAQNRSPPNRDVVVHGKPLFSGDRSECRRSATGRSSIAAVPPASDTAAVLSGFGWHPADCPALPAAAPRARACAILDSDEHGKGVHAEQAVDIRGYRGLELRLMTGSLVLAYATRARRASASPSWGRRWRWHSCSS